MARFGVLLAAANLILYESNIFHVRMCLCFYFFFPLYFYVLIILKLINEMLIVQNQI